MLNLSMKSKSKKLTEKATRKWKSSSSFINWRL